MNVQTNAPSMTSLVEDRKVKFLGSATTGSKFYTAAYLAMNLLSDLLSCEIPTDLLFVIKCWGNPSRINTIFCVQMGCREGLVFRARVFHVQDPKNCVLGPNPQITHRIWSKSQLCKAPHKHSESAITIHVDVHGK